MNKLLVAFVGFVLVLFSLGTVRQGLDDAWNSITHLNYYPIRDMRKSVAIVPNHVTLNGPDAESVPVGGKEPTWGLEGIDLATKLGAELHNPVAVDDSVVARGERKFIKTCLPCHGKSLAGDGPVAALFMPPPDLLAQVTRERPDGYLYSYVRNGGVVMPAYGAQVTQQEAWELIHYLRHMQRTTPR